MDSKKIPENEFNPPIRDDIKNSIDWAEEKGHMSGKQEGLIEGEKRGIIKGRQEGRIEGRQEGRIEEKSSVAKKLLLKGMEIDIIQEITGLSTEEVNRIKDELQAND